MFPAPAQPAARTAHAARAVFSWRPRVRVQSACGPRPPVRFAAPVRYRADSSAWMAAAAFLPAPMANMTVAAPVTASPPA